MRLLAPAAAVSSLVLAGTLLVWALAPVGQIGPSWRMGGQSGWLAVALGEHAIHVRHSRSVPWSGPPGVGVHAWSVWGFSYYFEWYTENRPVRVEHRRMGLLPYWFLAALASVLPLTWAGWRWRRRAAGLCSACGYDLRASPGPTCPECGTPRTTISTG